MVSLLLIAAGFVVTRTVPRASQPPANSNRENPIVGRTPVLVELFTSEGCSSCPPADQVLTKLDQSQPVERAQVIAISEHVDYWNRLGWTDPFSSVRFSQRQQEYAEALGLDDVFTPQMIVDGSVQFVGSSLANARDAIAAAASNDKIPIKLSLETGPARNSAKLRVSIWDESGISNNRACDVFYALTESGLKSKVLRGENSGRRLAHTAIARMLEQIGSLSGGKFDAEKSLDLSPNWKRDNLSAVVFVQEPGRHRVLGAAVIKLAGEN